MARLMTDFALNLAIVALMFATGVLGVLIARKRGH